MAGKGGGAEACEKNGARKSAEDDQTFLMDGEETPKKIVKKSANRVSDCCRMCKCSLNVKYGTGKSGRMSTQNLYIASNRDGSCGEVLASICENIGVIFIKSPSFSERVCFSSPAKSGICGSYLVTSHDEPENEDLGNVIRNKRQLPTSVSTLDRSPSNRKVTRTNREREVPSSRKSLSSEACHEQNEPSNISESQSRNEDLFLEHSNIDDLLGNKETMVKVIIVHPNGNLVVRTPANKRSKNLVKNISLKNWKAVAKVFLPTICYGENCLRFCREQSQLNLTKVARNSFQHFSRRRLGWVIINTLYIG